MLVAFKLFETTMNRNLDFLNALHGSSRKRKEERHKRVWLVAVAHPTAPQDETDIDALQRFDSMTVEELRQLLQKPSSLTHRHGDIDPKTATYKIKPYVVGEVLGGNIDEQNRLIITAYCDGSPRTSVVRQSILNGKLRDVSLTVRCNKIDGKYTFELESIALVDEGRKEGTNILYATNGKKERRLIGNNKLSAKVRELVEYAEVQGNQQVKFREEIKKGKKSKIRNLKSTCAKWVFYSFKKRHCFHVYKNLPWQPQRQKKFQPLSRLHNPPLLLPLPRLHLLNKFLHKMYL